MRSWIVLPGTLTAAVAIGGCGVAKSPPHATTVAGNKPVISRGANHIASGDPEGTPYGPVQVAATIGAHGLVAVAALQLPNDRPRSTQLSQMAGPILEREALAANSAKIDTVSGATYTSQAYAQSLQSAIDKANAQH